MTDREYFRLEDDGDIYRAFVWEHRD